MTTRKFKIKPDLVQDYVAREVGKRFMLALIILGTGLLAMFFLTYSYGVHSIIMPGLLFAFIAILLIIYNTMSAQIRNRINLSEFYINEDEIAVRVDQEQSNILNKVGDARNAALYGVKVNKTIKFSKLSSTRFKDDAIVFKSDSFDPLTENDKIVFPKELEGYDELKTEIEGSKVRYRLVVPEK